MHCADDGQSKNKYSNQNTIYIDHFCSTRSPKNVVCCIRFFLYWKLNCPLEHGTVDVTEADYLFSFGSDESLSKTNGIGTTLQHFEKFNRNRSYDHIIWKRVIVNLRSRVKSQLFTQFVGTLKTSLNTFFQLITRCVSCNACTLLSIINWIISCNCFVVGGASVWVPYLFFLNFTIQLLAKSGIQSFGSAWILSDANDMV